MTCFTIVGLEALVDDFFPGSLACDMEFHLMRSPGTMELVGERPALTRHPLRAQPGQNSRASGWLTSLPKFYLPQKPLGRRPTFRSFHSNGPRTPECVQSTTIRAPTQDSLCHDCAAPTRPRRPVSLSSSACADSLPRVGWPSWTSSCPCPVGLSAPLRSAPTTSPRQGELPALPLPTALQTTDHWEARRHTGRCRHPRRRASALQPGHSASPLRGAPHTPSSTPR